MFFRYHLTWRRKACFLSLPFDLAFESMLFSLPFDLAFESMFFRYHLTRRKKEH